MTFTDPLVPLSEAARALDIPIGTAYMRVRRTRHLHPLLPAEQVGSGSGTRNRIYVRRDALEALLAQGDQK